MCIMMAGMSMPMGQAREQRPQPVHSQGKGEATTSSIMPMDSMRSTRRVSRSSEPGAPDEGQPLEHMPQVRQGAEIELGQMLGHFGRQGAGA